MGRNHFFQFKQFRIVQEKAAMKVGIDGVMLGAWARLEKASRVLDIGAGTGLLALMAAQRSDAIVDAVELEREAADDARHNFEASPWNNRLHLFTAAFQDFETEQKYDHILSNPPFFENSPKSSDHKRARARHSDSLSLEELLGKSAGLLTEQGRISLILPAEKEEKLRSLARQNGLFVNRLSRVSPDETRPPHRILAEMSFSPMLEESPEIFIRESATGNYTIQYRELTKDFYLAF
ncbi:tRNA1(Val) (adenine(37)-N6)-methyltransferase [Gaoshiqia sediminis]|uniref:tRNA1(Val) (adenine(37)-N6)-methyltransferase n=1 Tax=Gaoshiqia sediminis TaxID=2986998 RepID=A0AA42CAT1_9BACT|nr:methyltransferase [Gaoshiqia sediminis]MCW0483950.1 methyltransferase [Gaoshiqia sediminis]